MCELFWNPDPDMPIRSLPTLGVVVGNHTRSDVVIITEGGRGRHLSMEALTADQYNNPAISHNNSDNCYPLLSSSHLP